jgi:sortase A
VLPSTEAARVRALRSAVLVLLVVDLMVVGLRAPVGAVAQTAASPLVRARSVPTTVPVTAPPTTAPPPAPPPEGEEQPAVARQPAEPLTTVGHLAIPSLGVDEDVYEGIALSVIDHGPSHWPGTAMPGHVGNVVIAGHRVTHSRPFRHLDDLQPGDVAILTTAEGAFTYTFTGLDVVTPDRVDITDQTRAYTATFFACHPPGSARYRIVARWQLVSAPAFGQPDPATL